LGERDRLQGLLVQSNTALEALRLRHAEAVERLEAWARSNDEERQAGKVPTFLSPHTVLLWMVTRCEQAEAALAALRQRWDDLIEQHDITLRRVSVLDEEVDAAEKELTALRQRHAEAVEALTAIAEHPHQQYDHPENGKAPYGTGCADGHRCAALVAKSALEEDHE
jgi:chromosome segregation ATPase